MSLSDKRRYRIVTDKGLCNKRKFMYEEEEVKQFIKKLKFNIAIDHKNYKLTTTGILNKIDELAGKELIEEVSG